MSEVNTAASAAAAARELATVLLDQAEALDLHDLRATDAIEQVRVRSRALADAVHERGWGELYLGIDSMFGEPGDLVEDDLSDSDEAWLDDDLEEDEYDELPAEGLRLSYQARYDFVVTDAEALVDYVRKRAAEAGSADMMGEIEDPVSAFQLLTFVDGLGTKDYRAMGLRAAGGEESQKVVENSLWDLDPTRRDDTYPY